METVSTPTLVSLANSALTLLGDATIASLDDGSTQASIVAPLLVPAVEAFMGGTSWRWNARTVVPTLHTFDLRTTYVALDGGHTYAAGDIVKDDPNYYRSLVDDNLGHALDETDYWERVDLLPEWPSVYTYEFAPDNAVYSKEYVLPDDFLALIGADPAAQHELALAASVPDTPSSDPVRVIWSRGELRTLSYSAKVPVGLIPPYAQTALVLKLASLFAIPVMANKARMEDFEQLAMRELRRAQAIDARQRPNAGVVVNGRLPEWSDV